MNCSPRGTFVVSPFLAAALGSAMLAGCPGPDAPVDASAMADAGSDAAGDGGAESDAPSDRVLLTGAIEKGPFVTGSTVTVGVLDGPTLAPIGTTYMTSTASDLGEFELFLPTSAPIRIEGNGFYYNEAVGALSTAPIVLRALYVPGPSATQSAYVNMVTHLTTERVRALVRGGAPFGDAVAQAETELREALAITEAAFDPWRRAPSSRSRAATPMPTPISSA